MFAIVKISGKQYKVTAGQIVTVDRLENEENESLKFDQVLMISDNDKNNIGTPYIKGAFVTAKVVAETKGEKIDVRRYKSKVRERRHIGFRSKNTQIEILKIETS